MAYTKTFEPHVREHAICYALGTDAVLDREHSVTVSGVRLDFGKPTDPSLEDPEPQLGTLEIGRGVITLIRLTVAEVVLFSFPLDSGYPFRLWMPPRQNIVLEITGMHCRDIPPPHLRLWMYRSPPYEIPGRYR
jgi:hypothetical protein